MSAVTIRSDVQLTPTQRGFLAAHLREPNSPAHNTALLITIQTDVDIPRLIEAFDSVVQATDSLRLQIVNGERAEARVSRGPTNHTVVSDIAADAIHEWANAHAVAPFDLSTSCYRSQIASHGDGTASWLLCIHHIATDAMSSKLVVDRTVAAYGGEPVTESRYFRHVRGADLDVPPESVQFWADREPAPSIGRLYTDVSSAAVARRSLPIGASELDEIEASFRSDYPAMTPSLGWATFLVTATAVFVAKVSGNREFAIGVPVHHRRVRDARTLIGPLMSVFPLDIALEPTDTFQSLHSRVTTGLFDVIRSAHLGLTPPADCEAVVNVILEAGSDGGAMLPLTTEWLDVGAIDSAHLLRVLAYDYHVEGFDGRSLAIDARGDADRTARHFANVVEHMASAPETLISNVSLCDDDEASHIATAEATPDFAIEPQLLPLRLKQRLEHSDQPAIEDDETVLTGRELWRRVVGMAAHLDAIAPAGSRIGIEMGPSIDALVAIFATMVSGRSFVPLDPAQPCERRDSLVARAGLATVLNRETVSSIVPATDTQLEQYVIAQNVERATEAYLLFTSGSSGEPKGVAITHGGIAGYIQFALDNYFANSDPVAPLFTALTFDLTLTTIFGPLLAGGRLVAFEQPGASALPAIAARADLTWCKATPSHLDLLLSLMATDQGLGFDNLVVGGESFGAGLATALLRRNAAMSIFNEYGPTEAVVGCMIHRVDPAAGGEGVVPIGVPAPGVELRVVDSAGHRVPVGVAGELLIASPSLFSGYLGDAEDAQPSPFVHHDGRRFYKSGDLVVRSEDLALTYLGRVDEQIKVGGIRVDPTEIEQALQDHPAIDQAVVRLWSPSDQVTQHRCARCGLPDTVPGASFDADDICNSCRAYDAIAPTAASWFRTESDLQQRLGALEKQGEYDCLSLLSGGKDSTYALHRLVDLGMRPYVLTLDNGFLSEQAKDNCRRVTEDLGLDHEFATSPVMNDIFRESLATFSDVCHGCFKTIYTVAATRARELKIPALVTGLSRGQLFQTRLIPEQFGDRRFDPDAIDRAVIEARKRYHRAPDAINRLLASDLFDTDEIFDELAYIDFYRYVDVPLSEMITYLETRTAWRRPTDTGRSTNCLINVAGISTHQRERGFHNYAEPYAWDVRLGHKTRDEAIAELDDEIDPTEVAEILAQVGYEPTQRSMLTSWITLTEDNARAPSAAELRNHLLQRLPRYAIPVAYLPVAGIPTTKNGKVDLDKLPAPELRHHASYGMSGSDAADTESHIVELWKLLLGIDGVSPDDDFFALGGDSLMALRMIVELGHSLNAVIPEELAFAHTTPAELAAAIDLSDDTGATVSSRPRDPEPTGVSPPPLANVELSMRYESERAGRSQLNLGRHYVTAGDVDTERFTTAVRTVAARHSVLIWGHGEPRRRIDVAQGVAVTVRSGHEMPDDTELQAFVRAPFDLEHGPLLRVLVCPSETETSVTIALHHACGDQRSLENLWREIDAAYHERALPEQLIDTHDLRAWQRLDDDRHLTWFSEQFADPIAPPSWFRHGGVEPDGFLSAPASTLGSQFDEHAHGLGASSALAAAALALEPWYDGTVETCLVASTRDHQRAQDLVGYLLNPVPVRIELDAHATAADVHDRARTALTQVLPHRSVPYAEVNAHMRKAGLAPPPTSVLVSLTEDPPATFGAQPASYRTIFTGDAVADLSFFVNRSGDDITLELEYSGSAVGRATAEIVLERFRIAFEALHAERTVLVPELFNSAPQSLVHGAALDMADGGIFVDSVVGRCRQHPARSAVECDDRILTWSQLGSRAAQVAELLTASGVEPGDRVVVHLAASELVPTVMLGVLAAGGVYVPVDPAHPIGRRHAIIEASHTRHVVSDLAATGDIAELADVVLSLTDSTIDGSPWRDDLELTRHVAISDDDPAYVIFTSGSTGTPNGVAITHRQMTISTRARAQVYASAPERFLLMSSPAFDSSLVGLLWTLDTGGTVLVAPGDATADPDAILELIDTAAPTHLLCVPTLYRLLLDRAQPSATWVNHAIVAGEACHRDLVDRHFEQFSDTALTNEYGPTEGTVWATAHHCGPGAQGPVPIGTAIPSVWLAIVDADGRLCPRGIPGELVIGGPLVADGYIGTPDHERFTQPVLGLPASTSGRYFRTGDRAVMHGETTWFLGRNDDQLNVGGVRVDPGEVEAVLEQVDGVANAAVVASDRRTFDELLAGLDDTALSTAMRQALASDRPTHALRSELERQGTARVSVTAHIEGRDVDEAALRSRAASHLPATARPSDYVFHDRMPRGATGKIDRAALSQIRAAAVPKALAPARGPARDSSGMSAARVAGLFADVLGRDHVDTGDSFFDVGGDSLAAFEVVRRLEVELGRRVSLRAVHTAPTADGLASLLREQTPAQANALAEDIVAQQLGDPVAAAHHAFFLHHVGPRGAIAHGLADALGNNVALTTLIDGRSVHMPFERPRSGTRFVSVAALADAYSDEIDRLQPSGSVVLIGFCQGGIYAHEVAAELESRGRDVELLVCIRDWHAPDGGHVPIARSTGVTRRLYRTVEQLLAGRQSPKDFVGAKARRLSAYASKAAGVETRWARTHRVGTETFADQDGHTFRPHNVRTLIVRAGEDPYTPPELGQQGWASVLSDYAVEYVAGDPSLGAAVDVVADLIKRSLDD